MSKKSKFVPDDSDLYDFQDPAPSPSHGAPPARLSSFPAGHCLVNDKWRNNSVCKSISRVMTVKLMGGLGVVDFQPSPNLVVLYLTEGDIICGVESLVTKMEKFKKMKSQSSMLVVACIFLRTELSTQYFENFQRMIVLQYTCVIVPITNQEQVPQVLHQMFVAESQKNPFLARPNRPESSRLHKDLLLAVCKIPGMGEKRSRTLLQKMESIRKIARARNPELTPVLGPNLARGVEDFFRKRNTI